MKYDYQYTIEEGKEKSFFNGYYKMVNNNTSSSPGDEPIKSVQQVQETNGDNLCPKNC